MVSMVLGIAWVVGLWYALKKRQSARARFGILYLPTARAKLEREAMPCKSPVDRRRERGTRVHEVVREERAC